MYQIIFLGSPYFEEDIREQLNLKNIKIVSMPDESMPKLYLYFGCNEMDASNNSGLRLKDLARELCVLPIVKDPKMFPKVIPTEIKNVNAYTLKDKTDVVGLINYILSYFGLINVNRKVFISYKRDDTERLANQLFDGLAHRGFNPFLDNYSIDAGKDFQEYLLHELSDSEIILLLNSPNFEMSTYTMEELNTALGLNLGVVLVNFPDSKKSIKERIELSISVEIEECLNKDEEYSIENINKILDTVEEYRAQAYKMKRLTLVHEIKQIYNLDTFEVNNYGYLYSVKENILIEPITKIPTSPDIHHLDDFVTPNNIVIKNLIFNGNYCRKDVRNHLKWLNEKCEGVQVIDIVNKDIKKGGRL